MNRPSETGYETFSDFVGALEKWAYQEGLKAGRLSPPPVAGEAAAPGAALDRIAELEAALQAIVDKVPERAVSTAMWQILNIAEAALGATPDPLAEEK